VQVGEVLEAVATDPGVMADIPTWARSTGHELVALEKREKDFRFVVKRLK
jgi:TusA-related sulfurtransferase